MKKKLFNLKKLERLLQKGRLIRAIKYLNKRPPGLVSPMARSSYETIIKKYINREFLIKVGKRKLNKAYQKAHKGSYWEKLLDEKIRLIEDGKIMRFKISNFRSVCLESLLEISGFLNQTAPNWFQWQFFVRRQFKEKIQNSEMEEIKEAEKISNKGSRHGSLLISQMTLRVLNRKNSAN